MSWLTANEAPTDLPRTWYAEGLAPYRPAPPLAHDLRAEVCVIGGGVTGLSAALHLAEAGRDTVLLEAAQAGWGASGRNGGQVGGGLNWTEARLARAIGDRQAAAVYALTDEAKALTRRLIAAHAPEADYRPGILYVARRASRHPETPRLSQSEVAAITGSHVFAEGVLDRTAGYINPLAYARGLAGAVRKVARVHENTAVRRLSATAPFALETDRGRVVADAVILATNGYHDRLIGRVADHVLPINNYIAVTEPLGAKAPLTQAHAITDDRFVVNYWWQSRDGRLVYGGGESYGRRFPKDIPSKVRRNLAAVYPALRDVRITHAWGGTLAVTPSRLPFAEELAPGLLTVGGYSGHGLALAALAGRAMAEHLNGVPERFDLLRSLPTPRLPGGRWTGPLLTGAGMFALSLRDRFGI